MELTTIFGKNLRAKRMEKGLKQKELAQMTGIAPQTLSGYEGRGILPPLENAMKLAQALGVSLDWLTGLSTEEKAENKVIRTKGDAVRTVAELLDTHSIQIFADIQLYGEIYNTIVSNYLNDSIGNLQQLHSLLLSGGLSREVYDLAVEGLCSKLDGEDVPAHPVY